DKKVIKEVPLENLLVETDSPFSSPAGGRNEPANLAAIVKTVAETHNTSTERVAELTEGNAKEAFGLW
ncbi:TatD family hydrolase, partial [archaeon]|nr:TatD family hydrolase [archaeon]